MNHQKMVKVSDDIRRRILADKGRVPVRDMISKYNLSKATIHRVLSSPDSLSEVRPEAPEAAVEVSLPTIAESSREFINLIVTDGPEEIARKEKSEPPIMKRTIEALADDMFKDEDDAERITERPRRGRVSFNPENLEARNALEQRIILNVENFAPIFTFIKDRDQFIRSLHSKSSEELQGILTTLETTRTTINLSNQMKQSFFMVARGTEIFGASLLGLKTNGFTENLMMQRQELDMIFREVAIEYAPMFKITTKPELRLLMCFSMSLMQTDSVNRLKETMQAQQSLGQPPANNHPDRSEESPEQRYQDL
jgi:hypothetical protein